VLVWVPVLEAVFEAVDVWEGVPVWLAVLVFVAVLEDVWLDVPEEVPV